MMPRLVLAVFILLSINHVHSYCQPGCTCFDEGKNVRCDKANLTTFPYMLNPMLKSLSLVDCKLKTLDAASISVYEELEFLDLSFNGIEELPSGFLEGFQKLRQVKLRGNKIRLISDDLFKNLPSLEILDLSNNLVERIMDDAFLELRNLNSLNLSLNLLQTISSKSFNGLADLSELDLSMNKFDKLTRDTFVELKDLAFLTLTMNHIKNLPRFVFMEQKKLVKLDLSRNNIQTIEEGAFSGLHSLKSLDLNSNELSDISSRNWPYLAELETLDLSNNKFVSFYAGFFEGLTSLRILNLERNEDLQSVELNAMAGMQKLDIIRLNDCPHFGFIDEYAFEHPNQLRQVFLQNSALTKIPPNLLNWRQVLRLELYGNPWICDCELLRFLPEIVKNLKEKKTMNKIESNAVCSYPEEFRGVAVDDVTDSKCSTLAENALLIFGVAASIIIILTLITSVICIKSRCCSSRNKEKNLSRAPLYTGGSSFTDSLTYDKSDPLMVHRQATLPIIKNQNQKYPYNEQMHHHQDYYSQIMLLPPPPQQYHQQTPNISPQNHTGTLPTYHYYSSSDDASPYATGNLLRNDFRQRPPSWVAPPPPPPTLPPPPLSYKVDMHPPVPSTEL